MPRTAAEVAAALGVGNWAGSTANAGWLYDELSGDLVAAYGSPALTAVGTPTYGVDGPVGDRAVRFTEGTNHRFSAGNTFDIGAGDDYLHLQVCRLRALPSTGRYGAGKAAGSTAQYLVYNTGSVYQISYVVTDGTNSTSPLVNNCFTVGGWNVVLSCIDRGATTNGRVGLGTDIAGTTGSIGPGVLGALSGAAAWTNNAFAGNNGADIDIAADYVSIGPGVAAGVSAAVQAACASARTWMGF